MLPIKIRINSSKRFSRKQGNLIFCGDFSAPMDPVMDTSKEGTISRKGLSPIFSSEDMYDAWRCLHTTERDFTFFSHVHKSYSRIDYFIADKLLLPKITKACIHNITWSDHAPITLEINQGLPCSNSYIWRNNTFILSQETHLSVLRKNLEEFFVINDKEPINCTTLWCTHKAYARGLLIQAATREKKRKPIW